MSKKLIFSFLGVLLLFVVVILIYQNLPIEIARKQDIALGNNLIKNIEKYRLDYNRLPAEDDWETLKQLGFHTQELGTKPNYTIDSKGNYEITFLEGFDGPYLTWNSIDEKWKIDFPTIFNSSVETESPIFEGNQILFIRPSEEKFELLKNDNGVYEVDSDFGFGIQRTIYSLDLQVKYKHLKYEVVNERFIEINDCKNCPIKIDTDTLLYTTMLTAPGKEIKVIKTVNSIGYLSAIDDFFDIQ
ncbi:hypothetical protein SAMN02927937_01673 [Paenimyroides aquimaris]|uniref:Uncharacterized protein n=1 Tax=Paenimyroides marinum TaxID=1159016 RepID=A0A1H6LDE6_9FLAO|nr:hypothetical protein [Paenimyroides aquimaris]SEH83244.1 hypothetical protein SAMN02927937_01673 [Paenimyroides aquimaris]